MTRSINFFLSFSLLIGLLAFNGCRTAEEIVEEPEEVYEEPEPMDDEMDWMEEEEEEVVEVDHIEQGLCLADCVDGRRTDSRAGRPSMGEG